MINNKYRYLSKLPIFKRIYNLKLAFENVKLNYESLRLEHEKLLKEYDFLQAQSEDITDFLSNKWIVGKGIEIGALHNPLRYNEKKASVKYVDRLSVSELRKQYPELKQANLVKPDYIDNGEILSSLKDESQDFIIANHMLEHCKNPILTIQNHLKKLKKGGILFYTIPDKRFTPDSSRKLTTIDHLIADYYEKNNHKEHYIEWVKSWNKIKEKKQIDIKVQELQKMDYSIHFHVWTMDSFVEFILFLTSFKATKGKFVIQVIASKEEEIVLILKKL